MSKAQSKKKNVRISVTPTSDSSLALVDDVVILATQAFCPQGHNLISDDNEKFDGFPGIRLHLTAATGEESEVTLSPFHGDAAKRCQKESPDGTRFTIACPICRTPLPKLTKCHCAHNGDMVTLFLTPALQESAILALCNVWGCPRSRSVDNWQIISEYLDGEIGD